MKDLIGQVFGELEVIDFAFIRGRNYYWLCRCSCGVEKPIRASQLKNGGSKTCGHVKDLVGQHFGKLTVISFSHMNRIQHWNCMCDCGKECIVNINNLKNGTTKSCGCFQQESRIDHGLSKHPLNPVWRNARSRCNNPKDKAYKHYGGRGIVFCDEWSEFKVFYDWAIAHEYKEGLELDRIDNDGDYCPENCRWATRKQQCNNTRSNRLLTFNGITKNYTQWSKEQDVKVTTAYARISRGKTPEQAFGLVI
jgi:hypothetical protein